MDPIIKYLDKNDLLEDKNVVRRITAKAANYQYEDGVLYTRGKTTP